MNIKKLIKEEIQSLQQEKIYRLPVNEKQYRHVIKLKKELAKIKNNLYPILQDDELNIALSKAIKRLKELMMKSQAEFNVN